MMSDFLVYKGDFVAYNPKYRCLKCMTGDECFTIEEVPPDKVAGLEVVYVEVVEDSEQTSQIWGKRSFSAQDEKPYLIMGTALWSDGQRFKITIEESDFELAYRALKHEINDLNRFTLSIDDVLNDVKKRVARLEREVETLKKNLKKKSRSHRLLKLFKR